MKKIVFRCIAVSVVLIAVAIPVCLYSANSYENVEVSDSETQVYSYSNNDDIAIVVDDDIAIIVDSNEDGIAEYVNRNPEQ